MSSPSPTIRVEETTGSLDANIRNLREFIHAQEQQTYIYNWRTHIPFPQFERYHQVPHHLIRIELELEQYYCMIGTDKSYELLRTVTPWVPAQIAVGNNEVLLICVDASPGVQQEVWYGQTTVPFTPGTMLWCVPHTVVEVNGDIMFAMVKWSVWRE